MDPYIDNFKFMELELQFHDDNTSCSSSLSTSISEDIDDLRLGAEANSFSIKLDEYEINGKRKTEQKIIVMKENHNILNFDDLNRTFSTITSISDLIDARECNPEEILVCLGFAPLDDDESRKSILSRFHSPPSRPREIKQDAVLSNSEVQRPDKKRIGDDMHASITKTKEWLAKQDSIEDDLPSPHREENQDKAKIQRGTLENQSQQTLSSKRTQQRKQQRRRWSKSRQSSFELLLPNVTEEDPVSDGEEFDNNIQSAKQMIRESSQEAFESQSYHQSVPSPKDLKNKLHKLEKQENINFSDEEIYTKETPAFHSSSSNSLEAEVENDIPAMENQNGCSDGNYSAAAYQVSPFKHFQPRTLATVKVDSFELEEIVSNESHPSPDSTIKRIQATKRGEASLENKPRPPRARRRGVVVAPCIRNETNLPSSSSSDSSSGFEEGIMEETVENQNETSEVLVCSKEGKRKANLQCRYEVSQLVAQYCDNLACTITLHAITSDLRSPWQRMFETFCSSRSKRACAGGVAEAALRFRSLKKSNEEESSSSDRTKNDKKSPLFSPRPVVSPANIQSSHPLGSLSNLNNNNINSRSGVKVRGRLQRYASSPSLVQCSASSPNLIHDRTRLASNSVHEFNSANSDLLSSISAITNLSCQSSEGSYRARGRRSGNADLCRSKSLFQSQEGLNRTLEYSNVNRKSIYNGIPSSKTKPPQGINHFDICTDKPPQNTSILSQSASHKLDGLLPKFDLYHAKNNGDHFPTPEQRCSSKSCSCSNGLLKSNMRRRGLSNDNEQPSNPSVCSVIKLKDQVDFSSSEVVVNFDVPGDCRTQSLVNGT